MFDSGRGVPAGDEERIFDRFVRVGPDASREHIRLRAWVANRPSDCPIAWRRRAMRCDSGR